MRKSLGNIIYEIQEQEQKMSDKNVGVIEEAYQMTLYLQELLISVKDYVMQNGFANDHAEIEFFKKVKPEILGKLLYYNKLYRIESGCPMNTGNMYESYFTAYLKDIRIEFKEHIANCQFPFLSLLSIWKK